MAGAPEGGRFVGRFLLDGAFRGLSQRDFLMPAMNMEARGRFVCIGWGSLVWDPRALPCGPWHEDGPLLPIEFARESMDARLTLVICPGAPRVPTLWTVLDVSSLDAARQQLGVREYENAGPRWIAQNIGFWSEEQGTQRGTEADTVAAWARPREVMGAVWTSLPPKFAGVDLRVPSAAEVISYLDALTGASREAAEAYVRRAPAQIDTPCRRRIRAALGWT